MSTQKKEPTKTDVSEGAVRPSISLQMIRHAESGNNPVYRNARYIYRGGTPEFDEEGWNAYVETHRKADPDLSELGYKQAEKLSEYLVPHLANQASCPVRVLTSPMKRALQTIRPTLEKLRKTPTTHHAGSKSHVRVVGYYSESDGCHTQNRPEEGMNPQEISELLKDSVDNPEKNVDFVGFPDPNRVRIRIEKLLTLPCCGLSILAY
jgi:broad specificity phosphatase PhoE